MKLETINFLIEVLNISEMQYQSKAGQYFRTVPGYDKMYQAKMKQFTEAKNELMAMRK